MRDVARRAAALLGLLFMVPACSTDSTPSADDRPRTGRQTKAGPTELRILKADPVVRFRAPSTTLRSEDENIATEPTSDQEANATVTRLDQVFDMRGDPGATVEAYRGAALSAGWRLVFEGCSRYERARGLLFTRTEQGYEAFLRIRAQLENPVPERKRLMSFGAPPDVNDRHLRVTFGPNVPPVSAGLRNNGPDCLSGLDPSDPDLAWPQVPSRTGASLCQRLPLTAARAVIADIDAAVPEDAPDPACSFKSGANVRFTVLEADLPRAYYEDRKREPNRSDTFLFYVSEFMGPGVWASTAGGPVIVSAAHVPPSNRPTEPQLRQIASRIQRG